MFICIECGQKTKEKERVFVGRNWCHACFVVEGQRSVKEDTHKGNPYMKTRPPKYMLEPKDYPKFGY